MSARIAVQPQVVVDCLWARYRAPSIFCMSTSTISPNCLGTVGFKNNKWGSRVAVTLQVLDLVRTHSPCLRAIADIVITPIGLQLFGVPIFIKDHHITFAPSRRTFPHKSEDDSEYEYTFGFATKAHQDIFHDLLMKELERYCQRHHKQSLEDFLEIDTTQYDLPVQHTPNHIGPVRTSGSSRYMKPPRRAGVPNPVI